MSAGLEVIADDGNLIGEGPIWDGERNRLLWTDISSSLVYQMDAAGTKSIINRDLVVNGIGLNGDGRLVFSGAGGLFLWSGEGEHRNIASEHEGEALSFNDMIVGPQGRVYAGTMYWGVRWKTVRCPASLAMTGIACTPLEPVPITPTRLPSKSIPSWGQPPVWYHSPVKLSRPGIFGI